MRVRVLKDFATANVTFRAGEVREIDPRKADAWLRRGLVCQDKSLDGASETKAVAPPAPKPRRGSKRTTK